MRSIVFLAVMAGLGCGMVPASAVAAPSPWGQDRRLTMTPEQFAQSASIKDDALEVLATITTEPGYREKRGLLGIVWNDNFLRAFIDKKTGATTYQLYQRIHIDDGLDWDNYRVANYETPDGPKAVAPLRLGRLDDCTMRHLNGNRCAHFESLAVPLDEPLLQWIAGQYKPDQPIAWRFRFKAQSGADYDDWMIAAEAAGLLAAVADYRRAHGLPGS